MFKREFCTTREAAEVLGVSLRTAQLWVDSGILQAWKTEGGHRRINVDSVEKLMRTGSSAQSGNVSGTKAGVPVDLTRLKILVVEDDNTLIKLYRTYIGSWNLPLQISTALNGYEALILIGREQPDLMIADLSMPGMDGFQMIRTLAGSSFREGMEIVVVTGMEDETIAAQGGLPENIKILHKPIPFVELRTMVEAMMADRAALVQG
ncbi:MAG: response regulator [Rhodocyclaceae bacterium]|nr:response regulator [Rhodocyclaceae bacterium]MDZ4213457.1 response regulator [Rhodocyclaceae bacterium]